MKQKKVLGLILSLVLVLCVAIPGTLASENLNQPALICEKTEHVHGDGCWTVPETPACGMEAGAGAHTHGDGCYGTVTSMSCTLPEDENHTHGDGCYVSQTVITCGLTESAGHVHDASCYPAVFSCTLEEHTHNAECYAAPLSDVEDAEPTCTCGSVDGIHVEGCALYVAPTCTCGSVDGTHVEGCPLYVAPTCTCGSVDGTHVEGCPLYVAPTCTCGSEDGTHAQDCPLYVAPTCTCGSEDGTHAQDCPLYVAPTCTCGSEDGTHVEGCPLYVAPQEPTCTCGSEDGTHVEDCPLYVAPTCTCGREDGTHAEDCPLFIPVREITESFVTLKGKIPVDVTLVVEDWSDVATFAMDAGESQSPLATLNITLFNPDGSEWQPAQGETVAVTLDAASLGLANGHPYILTHIHITEDDEAIYTDIPVVPQNGKVTFNLPGFSYVLVFNAETKIQNVEAFYPATLTGAGSTNDQLTFLGIYYDSQNRAHFLLAYASNSNAENADSKLEHITVENTTYTKAEFSGQYTMTDVKFSKVEFCDEQGNVIDSVSAEKKSFGGIFDITLPEDTVVREGFYFGVNDNKSGNGWKIGGNLKIDLKYNLTKQVAKGASAMGVTFADSVTVERGDWVIYKITVANTGTQSLSGMIVTDSLPMDAFDGATIEMGVGDAAGNIPNWQQFDATLFDNYDSPGRFTRDIYIKAQVKTDLNISVQTEYTNTAYINGMNMPEQSDSAVIKVNPPQYGTLTVSKAVTSENPMDPAPDDVFTFTITNSKNETETFTLRNGESKEFKEFPNGSFTVTETNADGYATKVNGVDGKTYTGIMTSNAAPVVAFVNQFSTRTTTLSITKLVEKEYANDTIPENATFDFTVSITGEGVPESYSYTIGDTSGTLTNNGTISLKNGQTAVISGIPVGAAYTVTENVNGFGNDYELKSVYVGETKASNGVSGTLDVNGTGITFTNLYKRHLADLTIQKSGAVESGDGFIFDVKGNDCSSFVVSVRHDGSVTIADLPIGVTYTVTERGSWSWRYTAPSKSVTLDADSMKNVVTIENSVTKEYLLDGSAYARNNSVLSSAVK